MAERITRKDIKRDIQQDDFVETLAHGIGYAQTHTRGILLAVAALALAVVAGWGVHLWLAGRADAANDALADAVKVFSAPIDAAAPKPNDPDEPKFPDETSRQKRAQELFEKLQREHSGTAASDVGDIYLATLALDAGKPDPARELWRRYSDKHPGDLLAASVHLQLLRFDRDGGKGEEVAKELRAMIQDPNRAAPEDAVLFELATTLDGLGKRDEAHAAYQRIVDEFPRSPYHSDAQKLAGPAGARPPGS